MLEHNLAAVRYSAYDVFVGVYPNDPETTAAVTEAAQRYPNVHLAVCPHGGPTSKADCLNWIYESMVLWEGMHGARFDAVVTHDAEDLMHPQSLEVIDAHLGVYDMVQIPVLPLPTPPGEWIHGLYCDEFAEYQTRDVVVRQHLGGFIAGCGVGTGFSRRALEALATRHAGRIFDPACLTEDYESGFRIHELGLRQIFVELHGPAASPAATREYFPRSFSAAVRQRTRWATGIVLQGWERHGWRVPARQLYWLWRDRKGLAGNLLAPVLNAISLWAPAAALAQSFTDSRFPVLLADRPWLVPFCGFTIAVSSMQMAIRAACVWRIYGARMALGVPPRAVFGNFLNCAASARALWRYFGARLRHVPLAWLKTDHCYPGRAALMAHKRPLGEVLADLGLVRKADFHRAMTERRGGERVGEYLVRTGILSEDRLYEALSVQQGLPLGKPAGISRRATSTLPPAVARKWRAVPFQAHSGKLFVAVPELPSDEMADELERHSKLEVRFQLVTPSDFRRLAREYLQRSATVRTG
jgi:adsorption protein B